MKKMLKENKGFSLVELLIALLIMAVIAGTAITLFGGVLDSSKVGADRETAESIKRAILTYMNASNDTDFDHVNYATAQDFVNSFADVITVDDSGDTNDLQGDYGPFLEKYDVKPQQTKMKGWDIDIIVDAQLIRVQAAETEDLDIALIDNPTSSSDYVVGDAIDISVGSS
jgi:type IV pilus assembly protein PilA